MSVKDKGGFSEDKKERRILSPEKKFQIFLESQSGTTPIEELFRSEGAYFTDSTRIRQKARQGALERLADHPGNKKKTVSQAEHDVLKRELEEKERALADQSVELVVL